MRACSEEAVLGGQEALNSSGQTSGASHHDISSMEWYFQQQRETHLLTVAKEKNDDAEARHELPLDTHRMKAGVQGVIGG